VPPAPCSMTLILSVYDVGGRTDFVVYPLAHSVSALLPDSIAPGWSWRFGRKKLAGKLRGVIPRSLATVAVLGVAGGEVLPTPAAAPAISRAVRTPAIRAGVTCALLGVGRSAYRAGR